MPIDPKTRDKPLEYYLNQQYPAHIHSDKNGGFVAEIKDLPGCLTQGESMIEVLNNLYAARVLWIETAYQRGDIIPLPSNGSSGDSSKDSQYSGRVLLRMPRTLHRKMTEKAIQEGVSLNQYIVALLSMGMANKLL